MTDKYTKKGSLSVSSELDIFLKSEILPGLDLTEENFWTNLEKIIDEFGPKNKALLEIRESMQEKIDAWHLSNPEQQKNLTLYKEFLNEIGYLSNDAGDFRISTKNVDPEISVIAGPQLVVPVMNARFALNAANARWGSLYDALYGTDMISEDNDASRAGAYNPIRGDKVIGFAKNFLDENFSLNGASYSDAISFTVKDGQLKIGLENVEVVSLVQSLSLIHI